MDFWEKLIPITVCKFEVFAEENTGRILYITDLAVEDVSRTALYSKFQFLYYQVKCKGEYKVEYNQTYLYNDPVSKNN